MQNGLIFKSDKVVVPTSLRDDMIKKLHSSHLGIEGSRCRASEAYYWPLMNSEIQDCITKCSVCNMIKPEQCREPLMSHKVPSRPWVKVGTDLFTFKNQIYMVTVGYYSNFIEMDRLRNSSSRTVIKSWRCTSLDMASQRSSFQTTTHNIPRKSLARLHSNGNSSMWHLHHIIPRAMARLRVQ